MTTFKRLLDRYKYAFFGGGSQVKIETEISLNLELFEFRLTGPFQISQMN